MIEYPSSITKPKGFLAAGVRAGIKEKGEDLALIVSEQPASIAGVFTKNIFKAAPVQVCISRIPRATARAIVANSGNANACTGKVGIEDARRMIAEVACRLDVPEEDVFVASTGVIGRRLPIQKIINGIDLAVSSLSKNCGANVARAIMTTDTRPKEAEVEFDIGGVRATIGGIAKGAGMICPNMATMLAFLTTDVAITPTMLQIALSRSTEISFNCLTIDGDTSTNDSVFILANGAAGNSVINAESEVFQVFQQHLDAVTIQLARQIAADGEGATKAVSVTVKGAKSYKDCRQIAKTIANSPLVKTAMFGCDPNWGRVIAAAGRAGVEFDPNVVSLYFGDILIIENGEPVIFSQAEARKYLSGKDVLITLNVGSENWSATVWTCDLSYDYVKINAEYHT
ncbi:MAG: bifunctional glutamate N-acetyltransferase/amino-acid acetyltransferase ArgJ [Armatimonadetes bacterium]|nr:bifunctional glutamate N-acetyltransferase/amino-acid acetyltransferase ArgJ [Armatimonadota bacterium]